MATIFVPTPMRKLTGGQGKIQVAAETLRQAIDSAEAAFPGFRERVLDNQGEIKRFVNVFVNGVDVRTLGGLGTPVRDSDEVAVIPAMAGGAAPVPEPTLVSVNWLAAHLNDPQVRLLDTRVADPRLPMGYRAAHIPGAVPFDLNRDVYEMAPGGPRMKSPEQIAKTLGERGIGSDSTIVLYDEGTGPLAGTVFWLLKYLGHADVRVLNGGWHGWSRAGAPTTKEAAPVQPVIYTPRVDESQFSTADWIQENSARGDVQLLDTRTDSEYYMGHIPGAANLSFDEALDYATQGLKDETVLRQQFERVGITPDKEIVVYCGSGSRSAHTYMVLKALGYPRVRNYKGSMMDWAHLRGLPIE